MSLNREQREDVEKMINDKISHTEKIYLLQFEKLDNKLDIYNNNILNYINIHENQKQDVQVLKNQVLTRKETCPYKDDIKKHSLYLEEIKTVKKYVVKLVSLAAILITLINAILIYIS